MRVDESWLSCIKRKRKLDFLLILVNLIAMQTFKDLLGHNSLKNNPRVLSDEYTNIANS